MSEQLGLEGMPVRLFAATPTRLTTWLECPRRYRMAYLERPTPPKGPPWAHNSVGAAVHNALKQWYDLPAQTRTPQAAGTLLVEGWLDDGFRDDEQATQWRDRARVMVEEYVAGLDPHDEPRGVERTVATTTRTLALSGRVDRIDERPAPDIPAAVTGEATGSRSELVIVDYKTGRRAPDTDECRGSLALAVYALGAQRTFHQPCAAVELHHVPSGQVAAWRHTPESLARHVRRAEGIGAEASAAHAAWQQGLAEAPAEWDERFPPRPGPMCSWCDFVGQCPQGRALAPVKASWAGLAED